MAGGSAGGFAWLCSLLQVGCVQKLCLRVVGSESKEGICVPTTLIACFPLVTVHHLGGISPAFPQCIFHFYFASFSHALAPYSEVRYFPQAYN